MPHQIESGTAIPLGRDPPVVEYAVVRRTRIRLPGAQVAVDGVQQAAFAPRACGEEQPSGLEQDRGLVQMMDGCFDIAVEVVRHRGVGAPLGRQFESFGKAFHRDQPHPPQAETLDHVLEIAFLDGARQHGDPLALQITDGGEVDAGVSVDFGPAVEGGHLAKPEDLGAVFAEGHVGHQIDLSRPQQGQATMPGARDRLQSPVRPPGDFPQEIAENAGNPAVFKEDLGRVLVDAHPNHPRIRLCGCSRSKQEGRREEHRQNRGRTPSLPPASLLACVCARHTVS